MIFIDIPGTGGKAGDTVMLYGHLDKQPEMTGWREGLGPWTPVLEGDKLYGRGGADDGYAIFASLTAINARAQGQAPARALRRADRGVRGVAAATTCRAYIDHLAPRIGELSLVVCLDSGCANYDQLWSTTSLRGLVIGTLEVSLLTEGVHSGDGTGVIAASERVMRKLLDRLDDSHTGVMKLARARDRRSRRGASRRPSAPRRSSATRCANKFPLQPGVEPVAKDNVELILNRTWRPGLAITGADGWPPIGNAGNVLRPVDEAQAVDPHPAARRSRQAAAQAVKARAREGSRRTARRSRSTDVRRERRLGRAGDGAVARQGARRRVAAALRQAGDVHGRGRHDPVHVHARREVPEGAVLHHRRARPRLERARPERVPAHPDGAQAHAVRRRRARGHATRA